MHKLFPSVRIGGSRFCCVRANALLFACEPHSAQRATAQGTSSLVRLQSNCRHIVSTKMRQRYAIKWIKFVRITESPASSSRAMGIVRTALTAFHILIIKITNAIIEI